MTIGIIALIVVAILILLGVGQRILDKLHLNDKLALLCIAAMIGLGFVPDIPVTDVFAFNIGGAVIPLALCVYLFIKADTGVERARSIAASLVTGAAIFAIGMFAPNEPERITVDPMILYGLAAGVIAYIFGRSRRCAFIAGVIGMMLSNVANAILVWNAGIPQKLVLGGAGAFDGIVISGLIAVLLAELIGEIIERMQRGTRRSDRDYQNGRFVRKGEAR